MFVIVFLSAIIAQIWNLILPINKTLWTSSYVLYSSGLAILIFAILIWIIDIQKKIKFLKPFLVFGVNSLFAYVFAELCGSIFSTILRFQYEGNLISFRSFMYNNIFSPILGEMNGSLFYSIFMMSIYWSILCIWIKGFMYVLKSDLVSISYLILIYLKSIFNLIRLCVKFDLICF